MRRFSTIALMVVFPAACAASPDYNRADWEHWADFDRDCQDTRGELLISESLVDVTYTSDSGC